MCCVASLIIIELAVKNFKGKYSLALGMSHLVDSQIVDISDTMGRSFGSRFITLGSRELVTRRVTASINHGERQRQSWD